MHARESESGAVSLVDSVVDRPLVLHIEDDPVSRALVVRMAACARTPPAVVSAVDGVAGLTLLERMTPDLLLLDLELPDIHGRDILRRVRAAESLRSLTVVVLSGIRDPEVVAETLAVGADRYITKPVEFADFLPVLDELTSPIPATR